MAFIEFSSKNVIGVPKVDDQHRNLFDILNSLHSATVEGQEQGTLVDILNQLIGYTVDHFQTEEELMVRYGYPELPRHKDEHDRLTAQAVALQEQFRAGSATISFELLEFLHDWLMEHTMGTDMEMGRFLQKEMA